MTGAAARLARGELGLLPVEAVRDHIVSRRWFTDRHEQITGVAPVVAAPLPAAEPLVLGLFEVTFATGLHDRYQLLLAVEEGPAAGDPDAIAAGPGAVARDALGGPAGLTTLVALAAGRADVPAGEGDLRFRAAPGESLPEHPGTGRPLAGDTSNSAGVVDESVLVKAYRRTVPGMHPELELLSHLARRRFGGVPPLLGWWEHVDPSMESTLGILQRFIVDARDGWALALASAASGKEDRAFMAQLAALGGLTAQMHRALSEPDDDPAFGSEAPAADQMGLITAELDERLADAASLEPLRDREPLLAGLRIRLAGTARTRDLGRLIRCHGDFHLAQVLRGEGAWWIVDFEGEPLRTPAERRRRRSPLRDVAGMLRSIDYAHGVATRDGAPPAPSWRANAERAFLEGYLDAAAGARLIPRHDSARDDLLFVMQLEKLLYELRYEMAHRPDWVEIPLAGLARLLEERD